MYLCVHQKGFSYLAMLFFIATVAISMAIVTESDSVKLQREKERDWLFVGQQYQQAIASYYKLAPDGVNVFPNNIAVLLLDDRYIKPVRHLRQAYLDPLTLQPWAEIHNENGQLIGVHSRSEQTILMTSAVNKLQTVDQKLTYHSELKFRPSQEMLLNGTNQLFERNQEKSNTVFENIK